MDEKNMADLLYVGTVYVEAGYYGGTPTAETISYLGGADLGGQISVELVQYTFGDLADLFEGDPPVGSVEMWKKLIVEMRDMLARCFVLGEMKMVGGERLSSEVDEQEDKNLDQAITQLADDKEKFTIKITPEIAIKALAARARDEQAIRENLKAMLAFIEAQQYREGEDITLEEAAKRHQEGTERLERMMDDDDSEASDEGD
jgi:hypothetical protein